MKIMSYQRESLLNKKSTIIEDIKLHFGLKARQISIRYRLIRLIEESKKDFKLCKTRIGEWILRKAADSIVRNSRKLKLKVIKVKASYLNSISRIIMLARTTSQLTKIMTNKILNKNRTNPSWDIFKASSNKEKK